MASGVFDDALLKHLWSTDELRAIFSDRNRVQKWYDYEGALALEQAELGIIPERDRRTRRTFQRGQARIFDHAAQTQSLDRRGGGGCEPRAALSKEELRKLLDPTTYVGHAPQIVDNVLAQVKKDGWLN